jgi:hypothetical protein
VRQFVTGQQAEFVLDAGNASLPDQVLDMQCKALRTILDDLVSRYDKLAWTLPSCRGRRTIATRTQHTPADMASQAA